MERIEKCLKIIANNAILVLLPIFIVFVIFSIIITVEVDTGGKESPFSYRMF